MGPGYGTTDLGAALGRAVATLAGATALNKEMFVISDFQRSGFGEGSGPGETDFLAELEPRTRVFLIPVDEGPLDNTALEDAYLSGGAVNQQVFVQGVRHADTPADAVPVTVEARTEVIGEAPLTITAGSRETLEITLNRMPGEDEELTARLARDRLPADDIRYVPAAGSGRVRTLLVQDPAQPSPFLPTAMSPSGETGRFEVRRAETRGPAQRRSHRAPAARAGQRDHPAAGGHRPSATLAGGRRRPAHRARRPGGHPLLQRGRFSPPCSRGCGSATFAAPTRPPAPATAWSPGPRVTRPSPGSTPRWAARSPAPTSGGSSRCRTIPACAPWPSSAPPCPLWCRASAPCSSPPPWTAGGTTSPPTPPSCRCCTRAWTRCCARAAPTASWWASPWKGWWTVPWCPPARSCSAWAPAGRCWT